MSSCCLLCILRSRSCTDSREEVSGVSRAGFGDFQCCGWSEHVRPAAGSVAEARKKREEAEARCQIDQRVRVLYP